MITRAAARPTRYLFVDAGHLRANFAKAIEAWCGQPHDLDVERLRTVFDAEKVFYYDCIDDALRVGETRDQLASRIEAQETFFREVNSCFGTHVRLGSITGAGKKRRQKEVDILIAVDAMNHAVRQNMDRAMLLTGDRDFVPLVETLVQFGLVVEIAGDLHATSDVLLDAADKYRPLGLSTYIQLLHPRDAQQVPDRFSFEGGDVTRPVEELVAEGSTGKHFGRLYRVAEDRLTLGLTNRHGSIRITIPTDKVGRLRLFLHLEYGNSEWMPVTL